MVDKEKAATWAITERAADLNKTHGRENLKDYWAGKPVQKKK